MRPPRGVGDARRPTRWLMVLVLTWLLPTHHSGADPQSGTERSRRPRLSSELRALGPTWLASRMVRRNTRGATTRKVGDGTNVIVVPGMFGGDLFYRGMHATLISAGFNPVGSRICLNLGGRRRVDRIKRRAIAVHDRNGRPVQFCGHSLGGAMAAVAAQELMVERPEIFAGLGRRPHLVTLSAPLDVAHKQDGAHPLVVKLGGLMRRGVGQIEPGLEPLAEARSRRIRMVNVSSDADGLIYPNSAALDGVPSVRLRHATHMTMGFDPVAITTAIQALAGGVPAAPAPGR